MAIKKKTLGDAAIFFQSALATILCVSPAQMGPWELSTILLSTTLCALIVRSIPGRGPKIVLAVSIGTLCVRFFLPTITAAADIQVYELVKEFTLFRFIPHLPLDWMVVELFSAVLVALGVLNIFCLYGATRLSWKWALLPILGITAEYATFYDSVAIGILSGAAWFVIFVVCGYAFKLVSDHWWEFAGYWRVPLRKKLHALIVASPAWGVILILVILGTKIHNEIAEELKALVYSIGGVVRNSEELGLLHEDLLYSLYLAEKWSVDKLQTEIRAATAAAGSSAAAAPAAYASYFEGFRPGLIGTASCGRAHFDVIGMRIDFAFLCELMIAAVNAEIQGSFDKIKNTSTADLKSRLDTMESHRKDNEEMVIVEAVSANHRAFSAARDSVNFAFMLNAVLGFISAIVVVYSVLASVVLGMSRLLFDSKRGSLTFKLGEHLAKPVKCTFHDKLDLVSCSTPAVTDWFVAWNVHRSGTGTYRRISIFALGAHCLVRRLVTGRLTFTRIRMSETTAHDPATISVPGDYKIVLLELEDQEIVLPMRSLLAFSTGIVVRSIYSTHVANHLVGLGTFYPVASGSGCVALLAQGQSPAVAQTDSCKSPSAFLAWDRAQEFTLEQDSNSFMWWINSPSLRVVRSSSVVLDERPDKPPSIIVSAWRTLRYLFLPI